MPSRVPLASARVSELLIPSRDREGAVDRTLTEHQTGSYGRTEPD